jgi:hypothetical protein
LGDDERISRPITVRNDFNIQNVATSLYASRSQKVDEVAAEGISPCTCHMIMSHVSHHSVTRVLTQDQRDNSMSTCGDLIDSVDNSGIFLNRTIAGHESDVSVRSATAATMGPLEIDTIAKKEESLTRQVKRQGNFRIV